MFTPLQERCAQKLGALSGGEQQMLADGRVELEGPSHELAKNEQVRAAYLGI